MLKRQIVVLLKLGLFLFCHFNLILNTLVRISSFYDLINFLKTLKIKKSPKKNNNWSNDSKTIFFINQSKERYRNRHIKVESEQHVFLDLFWNLPFTFMLAEILENYIVFIYLVLNIKEQTRKDWNDWNKGAKKKTVQEYDQTIAPIIAQLKLIIIFIFR